MTYNVIKSCYQDRLNNVLAGVVQPSFDTGIPSRLNNYLKFDSVASYGKMPMITLSGDFEIEFNILGNNLTKDQAIFDSQEFALTGSDGYTLLYLDNPQGLELLIGDAGTDFARYIFGGFSQILNNEFNKINVKRVGSTYSAFINDVQVGTDITGVTKDIIIEGYFFGGKGRYLDGIGSDLKIWSNGTLVRDYFIDEKGSNTQIDLANGQDMILFNVDHNEDWVQNQGYYNFFRSSNASYGDTDNLIELVDDFEVSVNVTHYFINTAGTFVAGRLEDNANRFIIDIQADGNLRAFMYTNNNLSLIAESLLPNTGVFNEISNVTVKRISGTGYLYFNGTLLDTVDWSSTGNPKIGRIGSRSYNANYLNGIIANLSIWCNGTSDTGGTLCHQYNLRQDSTTQVDRIGGNNITLFNTDYTELYS